MKKIVLGLFASLLLAAGCNQTPAPAIGLPDVHTGTSTVQGQYASLPVPEQPGVSFVQGVKPYVQIHWNYEIAKQFNVYRSTNASTGWQLLFANFPGSAHTAVDSEFPKDSRFLYYRVTSVDTAGHESAPSLVASVEVPSGMVDSRPLCPKLGPVTPDCQPSNKR